MRRQNAMFCLLRGANKEQIGLVSQIGEGNAIRTMYCIHLKTNKTIISTETSSSISSLITWLAVRNINYQRVLFELIAKQWICGSPFTMNSRHSEGHTSSATHILIIRPVIVSWMYGRRIDLDAAISNSYLIMHSLLRFQWFSRHC